MTVSSSWSLVDEYLKPIAHLFEMEGVSEIMVNGADTVFIERRDEKERVDAVFPSEAWMASTIQQIANAMSQSNDKGNPLVVDARLEDGSTRVCGYSIRSLTRVILSPFGCSQSAGYRSRVCLKWGV